MKVIHKYVLDLFTDKNILNLPLDASIVSVLKVNKDVVLYVMVDPKQTQTEERVLFSFGTGDPIPEPTINLSFIGTIAQGIYVWHLFEYFDMSELEIPV